MVILKWSALVLLLGVFFSVSAAGQVGVKSDQNTIWKSRADSITASITKDAEKIGGVSRALVYARLGDAWWKFDQSLSNIWFEKSVDTLIYKTDIDEKTHIDLFFQTTSEILKLISDRNQKQSERLLKLLSDTDNVSDKNKANNADTLIDFALLLVESNPNKALEIGSLSFGIGQPNTFYKLYWELRRLSPGLADRFFRTFLASAKASPNLKIIAGLRTAVFPELEFPNAPDEIRSPNLNKTETLNFFSDHIVRLYIQFLGKSISSCHSEAFLIAPLKAQVVIFTPQKTTITDQALVTCLQENNIADRKFAPTNLQNSDSIDELLSLADETKNDVKARAYYLFRASSLANTKKNYKRGIEILERMTKEERETDTVFWDELRYTLASGLAFQQVQTQGLAGARQTLEQVPAANRAFAKIGFALKFSPKDDSYRPFVTERIKEARVDLITLDKEFNEKRGFWFRLMGIFSDYGMPTDASETFEEIIKGLNRSFSDKNPKNNASINSDMIKTAISARLFESQEFTLLETVSRIEEVNSRIDVQFGLLSTVLKEYGTVNTKGNIDPDITTK